MTLLRVHAHSYAQGLGFCSIPTICQSAEYILEFAESYYIANIVYLTMPQAGFEPTEVRVATYLNLIVRSTSKPPRLG